MARKQKGKAKTPKGPKGKKGRGKEVPPCRV